MSDFVDKFFTYDIVLILGGITIFFNVFASFVIVRKSTQAMTDYKWILLGITLTNAAAFVILGPLIIPARVSGAVGYEYIGPLPQLLPHAGNTFSVLIYVGTCSLIWAIVIGFAFRLYSVDTTMYGTNAGKLLYFFFFLFPLPVDTIGLVLLIRALNSEEERREFIRHENIEVHSPSALFLILPNKRVEFATYCIVTAAGIILHFIIIVVIVIKTKSVLSKNQNHMSAQTLRLHKMLLRSLILQTSIPFFFICAPVVLLSIAGSSANFASKNELRVAGSITLILNLLTGYVVIRHSTTAMSHYKWILLMITFISAVVDAIITMLIVPIPLERGLGCELIGPLAYLFPMSGNVFTVILMLSIACLLWSIEIGFAYRWYAMSISTVSSKKGRVFRCRTALNLAMFLFPFLMMVVLTFLYVRSFNSEVEKMKYIQQENITIRVTSAAMLILPEKYSEHTIFSFAAGLYAVLIFAAVIGIILRIRRSLSKNVTWMSEKTIEMHRTLLRSLIFQSVIPFIFIFIPLSLLMVSVTSENVFDSQKETPYYAKLCPAIALGLFSFYSISHIIVMISFTAPYRQYVLKLLRRAGKRTNVSNSTGTVSVI